MVMAYAFSPYLCNLKGIWRGGGKVKAVAVVEVKGMEVALVEGWELAWR